MDKAAVKQAIPDVRFYIQEPEKNGSFDTQSASVIVVSGAVTFSIETILARKYYASMAEPFDHNDFSTIVFIDSMLALECKPLDTVPWQDIDSSGPILVLVVPQVNAEIDKRKRDGRLGKRARAFNRLIAPAAESGAPVRIALGPPEVSICVARCSRIDWGSLEDFDPQEGDHKVVAQMLHTNGIPHERKLLLSQDTNPLVLAANQDLQCRKLPEGWLLDPEPHPKEKDVTRLTQRVRQLEASEPSMELSLTFGVKEPLAVYQVATLTRDEQEALINEILLNNGKERQERSRFDLNLGLKYDHDYDENYQKFASKTVPNYVKSVHKAIEILFSQFAFQLEVINTGQIQAEDLIVSLTSSCGAIHSKFVMDGVFPPAAPRLNPYRFTAPVFNSAYFRQPTRDRHKMTFISEPKGDKTIQFQCADFRHGRKWTFDGVGTADPYEDRIFEIEAELTASNIRGRKISKFTLVNAATQVQVQDLVNLNMRRFFRDFPLKEKYDAEIDSQDIGWFDTTKRDD